MSSDHEYSDDDYYDEDMFDGTQDDDELSDDDMDIADDFKSAAKGKLKAYEVEYESLAQADVEKAIQDDAEHICGILGVDASTATPPHLQLLTPTQMSTAQLLLRHAKWNKERLIEKYMDNPSKVLVDAGVALPDSQAPSAPPPIRTAPTPSGPTPGRRPTRSSSKLLSSLSSSSRSTKSGGPPSPTLPKPLKASKSIDHFTCPICFDDDPGLRTLSLDCEHTYCSGCWTAYVVSKVNDDGEHAVKCMAEGCGLVAPDAFVHSVLVPEEERVWARFQELLLRYFVSCNRDLKFCPYPSCTNTVSCPSASSKLSLTSVVPIVSCGARGIGGQEDLTQSQGSLGKLGLGGKEHRFCFGCPIESDHRPVICAVAKMWLKKCRDDSETRVIRIGVSSHGILHYRPRRAERRHSATLLAETVEAIY
ncbi:hypothetical protein D9611_010924 [Ephemerocybe angulata]|uniref:RBR-type E3 ubiquitin transferase n=1 Tax=Ephemerocybe angulata TaxID=980116 RepID=A0A8H5C4I8_9AGAR|nr:hypothetical protein D9611_010924 [Tulosesus angulatus]